MDANRFDNWTRNRARRLSRRDALRLTAAGGAAAALTSLPSARAQTSCSLTLHGETIAGPSQSTAYDGSLQFTLDPTTGIGQATFVFTSGESLPATVSAIGRAIDIVIALSENQTLLFSGVASQPIADCAGDLAGILSGPKPGDLGAWQSTTASSSIAPPATATRSSGSTNSGSTTSCQPGQTRCIELCVDTDSDPQNCGSCGNNCASGTCTTGTCSPEQTCLPDGDPCRVPADCCSVLCPHDPGVPGVCGCSQIGGVCQGPDDCCQQGGDTLVACLGGTDANRCIVFKGACTADSDCLSGNCVNGECGSSCNPDASPCTTDDDCCSESCHLGICGCAKLGQSCDEDQNFYCCDGTPTICFDKTCCILASAPCSADADCCDYIQGRGSCTNGVCTRTG